MEKILLHTPEGVRDIYGVSVEHKLYLENVIHNTLKLYGYNDIHLSSMFQVSGFLRMLI